MIHVVGADISTAHFALVQVKIDPDSENPIASAEPIDWWFLSERASVVNKTVAKGHGRGHRIPKIDDPETRRMSRLHVLAECVRVSSQGMDLGAIEGFAQRVKTRAYYEIGGAGYLARRGWWVLRLPYRVYGPTQLKKFVCHKGGGWAKGQAKLISMQKARERWPEAVAQFDRFSVDAQKNDTFEDLVDAFSLAVLGGVELMLRSGKLRLDELHSKEIEVFNDTSKHEPQNLLVRPLTERLRDG